MTTLFDEMSDETLDASLLFTLDRLCESRPPTIAQWLYECRFSDFEERRRDYFLHVDDMVATGLVSYRIHRTGWRAYFITPLGTQRLNHLLATGGA